MYKPVACPNATLTIPKTNAAANSTAVAANQIVNALSKIICFFISLIF